MNEIDVLQTFFQIWVFIVGLCIGSFLNVVILRSLKGESVVFPSSHCPVCNNKLKWWMNIPVFSYLFLRGKCFYCKTKISIQYPLVEIFTGLMFLFIFSKFLFSIETIFFIIASVFLIIMSGTDIKESVIFDFHAYFLILTGLIFLFVTGGIQGLLFGAVGSISGFILYEIIARLGFLFAGQRAFGEGDSLIAAGIGAFFGWKLVSVSFVISVLIMAACTMPYFLIHSYKTGKKRTCVALGLAFVLILISFLISKFELIKTFSASLIFTFVIMAFIIWCVKQILSDMHKKNEQGEESFCMLPFGPAMAASFFMILFFQNEIETFIKSYFSITL